MARFQMSTRILVVEDDPGISDLIRLPLAELGYEVDVAFMGEDGLRLAREQSPDLILLDVLLPDVDGFTVLQRLREFTSVPILFITCLGDEQIVARGLELGADAYILKPFSYKDLIARIRATLQRTAAPSPGSGEDEGSTAAADGTK